MEMRWERAGGTVGLITACGDGFVQVGERRFAQSVIVSPGRIVPDWPPRRADDLTAADFAPVLALNPEVVIVGCGRAFAPARGEWLAAFAARGIGVETMDTRAACRTYNVLAADGRIAAAALIL